MGLSYLICLMGVRCLNGVNVFRDPKGQYPLNKLYLDEPEYKFYLGDSQILKKSANEFCLDGLNNYLGDSGKGFCQDGSKYGAYLGGSQILKKIRK